MTFLTPEQFKASPKDVLEIFLMAEQSDLLEALPAYEAIKGFQKRQYILPLVQMATREQLVELSAKSIMLNRKPVERSFLYRLNTAIQLRELMFQFEVGDYRNLVEFINLDADACIEFSALIHTLSEVQAGFFATAMQEQAPQSIGGLSLKLRATRGRMEPESPLIKALNTTCYQPDPEQDMRIIRDVEIPNAPPSSPAPSI
jgi:hypothetical protein